MALITLCCLPRPQFTCHAEFSQCLNFFTGDFVYLLKDLMEDKRAQPSYGEYRKSPMHLLEDAPRRKDATKSNKKVHTVE